MQTTVAVLPTTAHADTPRGLSSPRIPCLEKSFIFAKLTELGVEDPKRFFETVYRSPDFRRAFDLVWRGADKVFNCKLNREEKILWANFALRYSLPIIIAAALKPLSPELEDCLGQTWVRKENQRRGALKERFLRDRRFPDPNLPVAHEAFHSLLRLHLGRSPAPGYQPTIDPTTLTKVNEYIAARVPPGFAFFLTPELAAEEAFATLWGGQMDPSGDNFSSFLLFASDPNHAEEYIKRTQRVLDAATDCQLACEEIPGDFAARFHLITALQDENIDTFEGAITAHLRIMRIFNRNTVARSWGEIEHGENPCTLGEVLAHADRAAASMEEHLPTEIGDTARRIYEGHRAENDRVLFEVFLEKIMERAA